MSVDISSVIQIVLMIAAAIWAVSKVKSATSLLAMEIKHLGQAITGLGVKTEDIDNKQQDQGTRITRLEEQVQK